MSTVTIAIVYYRSLHKEHFAASVGSALSQTYADTRVVIFAEAPLPAGWHFPGCTVKRVPRASRVHPSAVREYIAASVMTPYTAFWDADDVYTPDRLAGQLAAMKAGRLDLCFSNFQPFDGRGAVGPDYFARIGLDRRRINILDENIMGLGITLARTALLRAVRPYPPIRTLDWWLLIRSHVRGARIGFLKDVHGFYRVHRQSSAGMLKQVTREDFAREQQEKSALFGLFGAVPALKQRADFFRTVDSKKAYRNWKASSGSGRNIWGGLIPYEPQK